MSDGWKCVYANTVARCFFEDKRIGRFLVTQAGYQGRLNVYNNPTRFEPVGVNYHYRQLKAGRECIPIWDNRMRMSF